MSLPPLPWSYETNTPAESLPGSGFVYLVDTNNRRIAALWGKAEEKMAMARFICEAANKRGGN